MKCALTIAGSDPTGGAGIQADLEAFTARGVHGVAAITAVTAQTQHEVRAVHAVPPDVVAAQIRAAFDAAPIAVVKTGMLVGADTVIAVATVLAEHPDVPLVIDPVIASSSETELLDEAGVAALREHLVPRAAAITPNLHEAARLTGIIVDSADAMREAAEALVALGAQAAVVTGGHAPFARAVDGVLEGGLWVRIEPDTPPVPRDVHGTGCRFAAALAAGLLLGETVVVATRAAKSYVAAILSGTVGPT